MGKKAVKSARKFAASGQLKKTIEARHKHQQTKKKFDKRRGNKGKLLPSKALEPDEDEDEEVEETGNKYALGFCALLSG
jgi:nucleolar complex protein 2